MNPTGNGNRAAHQVLVVDDDTGMRSALETSFLRHGWRVETAAGASEAISKFRSRQHPLVVTDIRMPDGDGFSVLRQVHARQPHTAVILLTAFGSVPEAVAAMKDGACEYLVKPVAFDELERTARQILARTQLVGADGAQFVGHSPALLRALERARQVADSDADVLIQAESGTGKELLARMIHHLSARRERPFVALSCAAFPETLLESELFGYTKGAFTGAALAKPGKFEMADGGTMLLDEVGEMPLPLQPKLLRVLQEREVDRLGDTRSVKVDIRVIATTNRPLEEMVQKGEFRADLYYRLNVIPLSLPALRDRRDDVAELAQHFVTLYAPPGAVPHISADFLTALQRHSWPGNVRELANLMRRAVTLCRGEIDLESLQPFALRPTSPALSPETDQFRPGISLETMERRLLEMTLEVTEGNRSRAAEMLGVSLRTVRNKIRDYGLPPRRNYVHD
jgi:DNA-binding NtrC family response regulator